MKSHFLVVVLLSLTASGQAQNFFSSFNPPDMRTEQKKVSLPNKPNRTDEQGRKQGDWARKYPSGYYRYEATFVDNKPVGTVLRYYEDGVRSAKLEYSAQDSCQAEFYNEQGKLSAAGLFINEKREGLWKVYTDEGKLLAHENYKNGELNGSNTTFYPQGEVLSEVFFAFGKKQGEEITYFRSGKKKCLATYKDDIFDGPYRVWAENGKITIEGTYRLGVQVGNWKLFDSERGEYFFMRYDNHGKLLNADEILEREQQKIEMHERNRHQLQDPQDYLQNPEEYRP